MKYLQQKTTANKVQYKEREKKQTKYVNKKKISYGLTTQTANS